MAIDLVEAKRRANAFLVGERLTLAKAREVFEALLDANELSMARAVLARIRDGRAARRLDSTAEAVTLD